MAHRLLVAVPCKDEAATIAAVVARVPATVSVAGVDHQVDVLVVDDGSTDDTGRVAQEAGARVVRHAGNRGLGAAFQTASLAALDGGYVALVTVDGDGQFAPEQIPTLAAPVLTAQADMATGSRFVPGASVDGIPPVKRLGNRLVSWIVNRFTGGTYRDVSCGFRCYSREALLQMNLQGTFTNTHETFLSLAAQKMTIVEVPVTVTYFPDRVSRVASSLTRYAARTLSIMVRWYRDYRPLRFFWGLATVAATVGLGFGGLLLAHYLETGRFSGYIFAGMIGGFLLLVALLLFVVGLLADMLNRMRINQERTLYMLRRQHPAPTAPVGEV